MRHQAYEIIQSKLSEKYGLDIVHDLILSDPKTIVCFADITAKENVELEVISGSMTILGFPEWDKFSLQVIFDHFKCENGYAKIAGQSEYFNQIKNAILQFDQLPNVTLPIVNGNGEFWIRFHVIPVQKCPQIATVFITDVSEFLFEEEQSFWKAHQDSLTGLFNRYTLDYHYGVRYQFDQFHVMFLDVDNFKRLNDEFGHPIGNRFLVDFASILKSYENNYNRFYRIGGDEFVGFFFGDTATIIEYANQIIHKTKTLSETFHSPFTSVSIGLIEAQMRDDVIRKADRLMYRAKSLGKNQMVFDIESNVK